MLLEQIYSVKPNGLLLGMYRPGLCCSPRRWAQPPHDRLINPFVSAHSPQHHPTFITLSISLLVTENTISSGFLPSICSASITESSDADEWQDIVSCIERKLVRSIYIWLNTIELTLPQTKQYTFVITFIFIYCFQMKSRVLRTVVVSDTWNTHVK